MSRRLFLSNALLIIMLSISLVGGQIQPATAAVVRSDAVVLVNSASAGYPGFAQYIQPYLDHFGIPYSLVDIATTPVPANIGEYALIITGHRQLDSGPTRYLTAAEEAIISAAVNDGAGLVNFDNDLSPDGLNPRYQWVADVFGFGYGGALSGSGVSFPAAPLHYIAGLHTPGESLGTGGMSLAGVSLPADVTAVASSGAQPFLAVTTYGAGRAVQWGSYDWMSTNVQRPGLRPGRPGVAQPGVGCPQTVCDAGHAAFPDHARR